jgi:Tfp pilus assembly protein PilV
MNARARRRSPASEEGFALIEVVVSAAVLVIVVLGVLAALDAVSSTASTNQSKTVAATLAEKDLERLRAYKTSDLTKLPEIETETKEVKVGKITYTVVSKAQWVVDSNGADISCALPSGSGSYLRITSTVSSPNTRIKPVTMSSIVAPQPGKGTVTGLVRDAAGNPVEKLPVQADGPSPNTLPTNKAGCAVFADSEAGSYIMRLNQSGWVDPDGKQLVEKNATVSAGNLTTIEFLYDKASSFNVKVITKRPGTSTTVDDRSYGVTAAHTGLSSLFKQITFGTSPGALNFAFNSMFPFPTAYQVYSGTCAGNNPVKALSDPAWFDTHTESVVQLTPAGPTVQAVALEPAMDVTVKVDNALKAGAKVYAYPKTAGCSTARVAIGSGTTLNDGRVDFPGLPFGTYDVCAQYTNAAGTKTWHTDWTGRANTNLDGTALATNFNTGNSATGACAS